MLSIYPAIFYRERDGGFSVTFPDLDHLATCGDDLQEAMEMAIDCLAGCVYSAEQDGETLPAPTPLENVSIPCGADDYNDYDSAFVSLVSVDVEDYAEKHFEKPVKKTVTVPDWLNKEAIEKGINFSAALRNRLAYLCATQEKSTSKKIDSVISAVVGGAIGVLTPIVPLVTAAPLAAACAVSETGNLLPQKSVKKTLTLPKWLNERAMAMNINFSAVLRDALLEACRGESK